MSLKILVFFFCLHKCFTFDLPRSMCVSNVSINNEHYNMSSVYNVGDIYPTKAHYDTRGNLFYVASGNNEQGYYFNIYMIKYKTTTPQKISGLPDGMSYSVAIDKKNQQVFFGTGCGLYSYDYNNNSAVLVSQESTQLDMIIIDKEGNKFVIENNNGFQELYRLIGNKKIQLHTLNSLNEIAIDIKNNFYFINNEQLCVLKSNYISPICLSSSNFSGIVQISTYNDNVFIANKKLIYFHENDTEKFKVIENIPINVTAIAFDTAGNFVLGVKGKILKYKKNDCHFRDSHFIDEYANN
ncbi:hypothetical protein K1T71_007307 [Dendrolimus kikuchii]|uniref:Uncharacterized protein n=1 Tax=Dendrolimus kikuchii TaxID=765133 RepID=A0ACC1D152_9NEOP|nr:hypothetical protein K1T71_007307 [Dendrolimus kikuchii]